MSVSTMRGQFCNSVSVFLFDSLQRRVSWGRVWLVVLEASRQSIVPGSYRRTPVCRPSLKCLEITQSLCRQVLGSPPQELLREWCRRSPLHKFCTTRDRKKPCPLQRRDRILRYFSAQISGNFFTMSSGAISFLTYIVNLEKKGKDPLEKIHKKKNHPMETAPWNCRFLSLVLALEAQQRYFSYRAILVAIVSQNYFVLVFMGYRTIIARYVAKWGIAQVCLCKTKYQGGVSHHFGGVLTSLKSIARYGVSQR